MAEKSIIIGQPTKRLNETISKALEKETMIIKKPAEVSPRNAGTPSDSLLSPSPHDLTKPNQLGLNSHGTQPVTDNIQTFPAK